MWPFCSEMATWLAITPSISRRSVGNAPGRRAATVKVPITSSLTGRGSTSSDWKSRKRTLGSNTADVVAVAPLARRRQRQLVLHHHRRQRRRIPEAPAVQRLGPVAHHPAQGVAAVARRRRWRWRQSRTRTPPGPPRWRRRRPRPGSAPGSAPPTPCRSARARACERSTAWNTRSDCTMRITWAAALATRSSSPGRTPVPTRRSASRMPAQGPPLDHRHAQEGVHLDRPLVIGQQLRARRLQAAAACAP